MGDAVYLVELTGHDDTNFGNAVTVRASSAPYFGGDYDYRARLDDLDILWQMEPGFERVYNNEGVIQLVNNDAGLDSWVNVRFSYCRIRRGDSALSYSNSNFPLVFEGPVFDFQASMQTLSISVADRLYALNRPITSLELSPSIFSGDGLPGSVCRGWLSYNDASGFSTGLAASDIDKAVFDQIDSEYPYELSVNLHTNEVEFNFLEALDNSLNGLPYALFVNRAGKVSAAKFRRAQTDENNRVYYPIEQPEIERIYPVAEVSSQYLQNDDRGVEDAPVAELASVKASYPRQWRKLETGTIFPSAGTDAEREDALRAIVTALLGVFNGVFDRLIFSTRQDVYDLNLGDQIAVEFPRYGYNAPVPGIVTLIRESITGIHELEIWTSPPLVQPTGVVTDLVRRPTPDVITSRDAITIQEGNLGGVGVRLNVRAAGGREVIVASNNNYISVQPPSLYFTPESWGREQLIVISADNTVPSANRSGVVSLTGGGVNQTNIAVSVSSPVPIANPDIVVSRSSLSITEGDSVDFTVRLSSNPGISRTVNISRTNTDLTVSKSSITFNSSNWSQAVSVTVRALHDADSLPETGTVSLSGTGLDSASVSVTITDDDVVTPPVVRTTRTHCVYKRASSRPAAPTGGSGENAVPSGWAASAQTATSTQDVWESCRTNRYEDGSFVSADAWGTPTVHIGRVSGLVATMTHFYFNSSYVYNASFLHVTYTVAVLFNSAPTSAISLKYDLSVSEQPGGTPSPKLVPAGRQADSWRVTVAVPRYGQSTIRAWLVSGDGYSVGTPSSISVKWN